MIVFTIHINLNLIKHNIHYYISELVLIIGMVNIVYIYLIF